MSSNEEIVKTPAELSNSVKSLSKLPDSVKSIQDEIVMLKCGATYSGLNPQPTSSQHSDIDISAGLGLKPPLPKKRKPNDNMEIKDEEPEYVDIELTGHLVNLSEAAQCSWKWLLVPNCKMTVGN